MIAARRRFLEQALGLGVLGFSGGILTATTRTRARLRDFRIRIVTSGPKHHFFGYYGICPWNESGQFLLSLESDFQDHFPSPDEPVSIGLVDSETGEFSKVAESRAWNLQQGAMLHWSPLCADEIIYNDRRGNEIVSVVPNVKSGSRRLLPRPVSALSHNGRFALSLTYGRLRRLRKTVGYEGAEDPNPNSPHPDNDGVFLMNMATGKHKLIVSIEDVYRILVKKHPELKHRHMWFNHTVFNRNDTRFFFLARTRDNKGRLETGMMTANLDGSELREVIPYGTRVSHFDWRNDRQIIATFAYKGQERKHILFTDGKDDYEIVAGQFFAGDGHCTFSPDQKWIATDQKHYGTLEQSLLAFNVESNQGIVLARLSMKEKRYISGDLRCDFHPRWNRTGDAICFDALEAKSGTRQLHVAHLELG
ncbi:MAG: hypothetical protein JSU70_07575 [Phycisphaerales bacterium]|nr:MAG: hypothetical protein JSU70_07575 [Phycisphaerales bacterium]